MTPAAGWSCLTSGRGTGVRACPSLSSVAWASCPDASPPPRRATYAYQRVTGLQVAEDRQRGAAGSADRGASCRGKSCYGEGGDDPEVAPGDREVGGGRVEDAGEHLDQHL